MTKKFIWQNVGNIYIYILIEALLEGLPKKLRNKKEVLIPFFIFLKRANKTAPLIVTGKRYFVSSVAFIILTKRTL